MKGFRSMEDFLAKASEPPALVQLFEKEQLEELEEALGDPAPKAPHLTG